MTRDHVPLLLREAVISLYPADANGNALIAAPVFCGVCANGLRLGLSWEEELGFTSGDAYKTAHHNDEQHAIEVDRSWVLRTAAPGELVGPQRGQRYVLEIVWSDVRERLWYKRLYYGVTGRSSDLNSDGARSHNNPQVFRAQRFVPSGGTSGPASVFTPITVSGNEQLAGFFGENPLLPDTYLLGHYRWSGNKRITGGLYACWPPQSPTVLGLEINGVLTGDTVTVPAGTANTDFTDDFTFSRDVPAGMEVRWKVVSGPAIEESAWHLGLVMRLVEA